jgi:hypothetical protein
VGEKLEAKVVRAGAAADPLTQMIVENAVGSLGMLGAAGEKTAAAMEILHAGFGNKKAVKYLKGQKDEIENAAGIKGLTIRILAPSTEEQFIKKMDPPKQQDYPLGADGLPDVDAPVVPFADRWTDGKPLFALAPGELATLTSAVEMPLQALALTVDNYLNNTSLALLLEFDGKTFLFPGDAQWGNWNSWFDEWDEVLKDIAFYKVGHHGSRNATPHGALEAMKSKSLVAMASTDVVKQFQQKNPVPYGNLVKDVKLQTANRYAQSDNLKNAAEPFKVVKLNDAAKTEYCEYAI